MAMTMRQNSVNEGKATTRSFNGSNVWMNWSRMRRSWDVFEPIDGSEPSVQQELYRGLLTRDLIGAPTKRPAKFLATSLLAFFADRLKVYLREKGARHDLIDAVFALPGQDDLLMIVRRVEALGQLLDTEDGKNLLTGYRRAANILRAEEKKDGAEAFAGKHVQTTLAPPAERYLADAVASAGAAARERVAAEDFEGAMRALGDVARARRRLLPRRDGQRPRPSDTSEPIEIAQ